MLWFTVHMLGGVTKNDADGPVGLNGARAARSDAGMVRSIHCYTIAHYSTQAPLCLIVRVTVPEYMCR